MTLTRNNGKSSKEANVEKKTYERTTKTGKTVTRYGLSAVDEDGTKLTKFCSKEVFDSLG